MRVGLVVNNEIVKLKLLAVTGDCPALKIALNFISHNGYYACYFCYIHGVHQGGKRQYPYQSSLTMRTVEGFSNEAATASKYEMNVHGHLGRSIFDSMLDTSLPHAIVIDYAHATLLRHTKSVLIELYQRLKPNVRREVDAALLQQSFPHFFHRRMKPFSEFSFVKATEIRNILLYGFIPVFYRHLPPELFAHFCLFVCGIRLLHGSLVLGDETHAAADKLLKKYIQDFHSFYNNLENFVLHLHCHFVDQCRRFGSLCHLGSFGQESLIGYMSSNFNGSRYHGELICENYTLDFLLHHQLNEIDPVSAIDEGPFDPDVEFNLTSIDISFFSLHSRIIDSTLVAFRRCKIREKVFHSLHYNRRKNSTSYIVRYQLKKISDEIFCGSIVIFVKNASLTYALIERYSSHCRCSDLLSSSSYQPYLSEVTDHFFYVLSKYSPRMNDWIIVSDIIDHCILFDCIDFFIATPVSSYDEHD